MADGVYRGIRQTGGGNLLSPAILQVYDLPTHVRWTPAWRMARQDAAGEVVVRRESDAVTLTDSLFENAVQRGGGRRRS